MFPGITWLETEMALEVNFLPDPVEFQWVDGEGWSKICYILFPFLPCPAISVVTQTASKSLGIGVLEFLVSFAADIDVSGNIVG